MPVPITVQVIESRTVNVTTDANGIATIYFNRTFGKPPSVTITPFPYTDANGVKHYPNITILEVTNTYVKFVAHIGANSEPTTATQDIYAATSTKDIYSVTNYSTGSVVDDIDYSTGTFVTDVSTSTKHGGLIYSYVRETNFYIPDSYAYWRIVDDPDSEPDTGCYTFCSYTSNEYWLYSSDGTSHDVQLPTSTLWDDYVTDVSTSTGSAVTSITKYTRTVVTSITTETVTVPTDVVTQTVPTSDHTHQSLFKDNRIVPLDNKTIKVNYIAVEQ